MDASPRRFGHLTFDRNLEILCRAAKRSKGPIIEFGTFTGRTTFNMALNTIRTIHTIDTGQVFGDEGYQDYNVGEEFLGKDMPGRINLIIGDSKKVEIPVVFGTAGLVFVDGGHDGWRPAGDRHLRL